MNYKKALQSIDPSKALKLVDYKTEQEGAYIKFSCIGCGNQAIIKAYGEKKNLWYCPTCKKSGHIISLVMEIKNMVDTELWDYEKTKKYLLDNNGTAKRLTEELKLNYELEYDKFLESYNIGEEICKEMGIGRPKGQKMLAGCVAFEVRKEDGVKIAYYGIRIKDQASVFYRTFNPEKYLYNLDKVEGNKITVVRGLLDCVNALQISKNIVSNFGLPYLSTEQIILLKDYEKIHFVDPTNEMIYQAISNLDCWLKITKK